MTSAARRSSSAPDGTATGAPMPWPAAIHCFMVRAIDDLGHEHEGHGGNWRGYGAGEGHGEFTLWPAVPYRAGRLRVVISTLWEARWADIEMPGR